MKHLRCQNGCDGGGDLERTWILFGRDAAVDWWMWSCCHYRMKSRRSRERCWDYCPVATDSFVVCDCFRYYRGGVHGRSVAVDVVMVAAPDHARAL